jgi:hypothetical protein
MEKDISHPRSVLAASDQTSHFLTGVDFNKLQTSSKAHQTDTLSLGEPPPQINGLLAEIVNRFAARLMYLLQVVVVTVGQIAVGYLLIFAPVQLLSQLMPAGWFDVHSILPASFLENVAMPYGQLAFLACLFLVLYFLNAVFDIFWRLQFVPFLMVPTWIVFQARSNFEKIIEVNGNSLHFGLLKVRYEYNDQVFFIRAASDHAATVIHFSMIHDVIVDHRSGDRWRGKHKTPPVLVSLEEGRQRTFLRIHGAYFEENGPGTSKAEAFRDGLLESVRSYKAAKEHH